jgi:hypothetical protein
MSSAVDFLKVWGLTVICGRHSATDPDPKARHSSRIFIVPLRRCNEGKQRGGWARTGAAAATLLPARISGVMNGR